MEQEFQVRISRIDVSRVSITAKPEDKETKNVVFDITVRSGVDQQKELIVITTDANISLPDKSQELANFTVLCAFHLNQFDLHVQKNEAGLYHVPEQLDRVLRTVSIGTVRGIIFSELKGSYLSGALMPIILFPVAQPQSTTLAD